jgi:hypothetical protein
MEKLWTMAGAFFKAQWNTREVWLLVDAREAVKPVDDRLIT